MLRVEREDFESSFDIPLPFLTEIDTDLLCMVEVSSEKEARLNLQLRCFLKVLRRA